MSYDHTNQRERRAHFGQRKIQELGEKYESLLRRHELANTLTFEMKEYLGNLQIDHENNKRELVASFIEQAIEYLENPPSPIATIKVETAKV
ncbi:MAG: hypothetical protein NUV80_01055 [Candidatus Berkelbacteria bacterium]|nr:hypothetical protein [Candidatus Berkelbacteria bacterium]